MTNVERSSATLYLIGGWTAMILLGYSLVTMILLATLGGQPDSAQAAFALLGQSRLIGFFRLDGLTVLTMPLYYLLLLGLYAALRRAHPTLVIIAGLLGYVGVTLFIATPSVFSWLALYGKYAAAASEAESILYLAAGEAILASDMWHGTGALMGGLLLQTGLFLISLSMLRGAGFGRATAWVGTITHGLDLLHVLAGFILPAGSVVLMMIAGPLYLIWFPLLARDFWRLSRG